MQIPVRHTVPGAGPVATVTSRTSLTPPLACGPARGWNRFFGLDDRINELLEFALPPPEPTADVSSESGGIERSMPKLLPPDNTDRQDDNAGCIKMKNESDLQRSRSGDSGSVFFFCLYCIIR